MKLLQIIAVAVFCSAMCSNCAATNREELINAAIHKVHSAESLTKTPQLDTGAYTSEKLHAYKRASKEAVLQGNARLKFEKIVHIAEKNIIEDERKKTEANSLMAKAAGIAKELIHRPGSVLTSKEIAKIYQESECDQEVPDCSSEEMRVFRTPSGVCNNLQKPLLGSSHTPFRRLIQAQYEDGFSQLRGTMQSQENTILREGPFSPPNPSPRIVSLSVVKDQPLSSNNFSHILMLWGQFIDHDLDLAPPTASASSCKGCETNERCVPIRVPISDFTFGNSSMSQVCVPFSRSMPACDAEAKHGVVRPREQINDLNSFVDGSQIYGSSKKVFDAVRDAATGLLRAGPNIPANGGSSLPEDTDDLVECMGTQPCFLAGDVRVNEHSALTVMHTIWLREHNRIAQRLGELNPMWKAEKIFDVTRSIVGAEIQKITYKDYLPIVLGEAISSLGPYTGYNPEVDPTIPNAFAAAAFRFGHSQINPFFDRLDENYNPATIGPLNLLDAFFNPSQYEKSGGTDPILRGLLTKPSRQVDEFLNDILTNHLFQTSTDVGMDLASLNIQRGRDHGLPPYLTWKRWAQRECNISSEFENDLTLVRLLQTYGTLETVDLWVGGLAEQNVPGGLVGATFACIFAKTFKAVRDGDRFYYENSDGLFNAQQRAAIDKASLSRIICDNADNIDKIQPNAFRADQERSSCSQLPSVNLRAWQDSASESDDHCYLQLKMSPQTRTIKFFTKSGTKRSSILFLKTVRNSDTNACLRIVCPKPNKSVKAAVFPLRAVDRQRCMVQPNSLLNARRGKRGSSFRALITAKDLQETTTGVYTGLASCRAGSSSALTFNCGGDVGTIQDEALLQELEDAISVMDNSENSQENDNGEIPVDSVDTPDDVLKYFEDDFDKISVEQDISEQEQIFVTTEDWKSKSIDLLEQLLQTLKGTSQAMEPKKESFKEHVNKDDKEYHKELIDTLTKLLKTRD